MTTKFEVGEQVLVPAAKLVNPDGQPFALMRREVRAQDQRSVSVDDGAGGQAKIASRLVHRNTLGFLVLRVGDLATETTLLNPLAKSVLQFLRLLLPDEDVRMLNVRTVEELQAHWTTNHGATSHVVLVGHGTPNGLLFLNNELSAKALGTALAEAAPTGTPKTWVSLACLTGRAGFGRPFSTTPACKDLVAPFKSVHGAAASHFCQSLLTEHLLEGMELIHAYRRAARGVAGGHSFRRWRNGEMSLAGGT